MTKQLTRAQAEIGQLVGQAMVDQRWADVLAHLATDVVLHVPMVGTHRGIDAIAEFLADTAAKADDGESFTLLDVLVGASFVALYFHISATREGQPPLDNHTVHLARLNTHNQISEIWFHNFDSSAVAAFWA